MSSETNAYLITATRAGESVQNVAVISKDKDYAMTETERAIHMRAVIDPMACEKFGPWPDYHVVWVKGFSQITYSDEEILKI